MRYWRYGVSFMVTAEEFIAGQMVLSLSVHRLFSYLEYPRVVSIRAYLFCSL
ncbi:MAG: hypothetical protein CM15mP74_03500 [Halieaceae bacterium]|nr:MAG: hypothetical protein CM15mP74_03500 [Halieaceae bacterium]